MTCCPNKEWWQYIVQWCAWWVRVDQVVSWKFLRPSDRFFEYTSDYVTFTETRPVWWNPWPCLWASEYDFEAVTLTNDWWITKVPWVARWEVIDWTPIQKLYDALWNDVTATHKITLPSEWERFDISDKSWFCELWVNTISRVDIVNVSWITPLVVGSIWQDIDWVMIAPPAAWTVTVWQCLVAQSSPLSIWVETIPFNDSIITTLTPPLWSKYAIVEPWNWDIIVAVDWSSPSVTNWHRVREWERAYLQIEDEINDWKAIWMPWNTGSYYVTYYDKHLLLSQQ